METSRDDFVIAIRSAFLKKGNQQRFSLLSLILFSIIFLILGSFNFKLINFNRTIIKEVIYISSFIATIPENTLKKASNKVSDHFGHYDDYQIAKNKLEELKKKDLSKQIIEFENIELKKLIDDYFVEDSKTYAKVLLDKNSPFLRSIIINKGSKNGVKAGMIVYDGIYLIGKVVEVNFLTSRILLLSDINSKVPVTIQPLNLQAIMSGLDKQKGKLQYIKGEKLINKENKELIVVTSGLGGVFKSGIPIGTINLENSLNKNKIIVDFYTNFSQLKYVKVLSSKKEFINLDQSNKKTYEANKGQILKMNSQLEDIKVLLQQKIIAKEIRNKLENENIRLKGIITSSNKKLDEQDKKIKKYSGNNIEFLELNLLHGHKCRRTFLKSNLFKINTPKYKDCVLKKGLIKNN